MKHELVQKTDSISHYHYYYTSHYTKSKRYYCNNEVTKQIIRLEFLIDIIHNIPIHLTITNAFQGRFNGTQCSDTNGYKVSQIN